MSSAKRFVVGFVADCPAGRAVGPEHFSFFFGGPVKGKGRGGYSMRGGEESAAQRHSSIQSLLSVRKLLFFAPGTGREQQTSAS